MNRNHHAQWWQFTQYASSRWLSNTDLWGASKKPLVFSTRLCHQTIFRENPVAMSPTPKFHTLSFDKDMESQGLPERKRKKRRQSQEFGTPNAMNLPFEERKKQTIHQHGGFQNALKTQCNMTCVYHIYIWLVASTPLKKYINPSEKYIWVANILLEMKTF